MIRKSSDAPSRLQQAAMTLFIDRGYDEVTVAEIAERAGMTKRSFFNHFADKREVMFASADAFREDVLGALAAAPAELSPLDAVMQAFTQAAAGMEDYIVLARTRQAIIDSSPDLQERDLLKIAAMTAAIADALVPRGVSRRDAVLVAQAATTVFTTAVGEWIRDPRGGLVAALRDALDSLKTALAGSNLAPSETIVLEGTPVAESGSA